MKGSTFLYSLKREKERSLEGQQFSSKLFTNILLLFLTILLQPMAT